MNSTGRKESFLFGAENGEAGQGSRLASGPSQLRQRRSKAGLEHRSPNCTVGSQAGGWGVRELGRTGAHGLGSSGGLGVRQGGWKRGKVQEAGVW